MAALLQYFSAADASPLPSVICATQTLAEMLPPLAACSSGTTGMLKPVLSVGQEISQVMMMVMMMMTTAT